jgi:hypothetical protein
VTIAVTGLANEDDVDVLFGGMRARTGKASNGRSHVSAWTPRHFEGPVDVTIKTRTQSATLAKAYSFGCAARSQWRQLLLIALAGALGATLHGLRSFTYFRGNRNLKESWLAWYVALPFMGAAIGTVFFLVFLGGLFSVEGASGDKFLVMIGIAALVGMFSQEAVEKLKQIAQAVLTPLPPSKDQGPGPEKVVLAEVLPDHGSTNGGEIVRIIGSGFTDQSVVTFDKTLAKVTKANANCLTVETPQHVAGKVDVEVRNGTQKATLTGAFQYE